MYLHQSLLQCRACLCHRSDTPTVLVSVPSLSVLSAALYSHHPINVLFSILMPVCACTLCSRDHTYEDDDGVIRPGRDNLSRTELIKHRREEAQRRVRQSQALHQAGDVDSTGALPQSSGQTAQDEARSEVGSGCLVCDASLIVHPH